MLEGGEETVNKNLPEFTVSRISCLIQGTCALWLSVESLILKDLNLSLDSLYVLEITNLANFFRNSMF
jgi:hypothetical protein